MLVGKAVVIMNRPTSAERTKGLMNLIVGILGRGMCRLVEVCRAARTGVVVMYLTERIEFTWNSNPRWRGLHCPLYLFLRLMDLDG